MCNAIVYRLYVGLAASRPASPSAFTFELCSSPTGGYVVALLVPVLSGVFVSAEKMSHEIDKNDQRQPDEHTRGYGKAGCQRHGTHR